MDLQPLFDFLGKLLLLLAGLLIYCVANPKLLSFVWELVFAPLVHLIPKTITIKKVGEGGAVTETTIVNPVRIGLQRALIMLAVVLLMYGLKQAGVEVDFTALLFNVLPGLFGEVPPNGDFGMIFTTVLTGALTFAWHKRPLPRIFRAVANQ